MERLARTHGAFNLAAGLWPLLHYRSFAGVTGPKVDKWLVQTVAGLSMAIGYAMVRAGSSPEGMAAARRLGVGSALAFGAVDAAYGSKGRIRRVYLVDLAVELAWLAAWASVRREAKARRRSLASGSRRPT
ncbi:hypothetical protein NCCP1664_07570 [Zafaria cholistanensis]|uniref:Uncharacterized protein n=1 Tax=Zafaria cholistanensis TaxID=1682741 RepID=A0A5A7NN87_9MICC|nr:hypothetical protein [Zafaria cholistanensis]GER22260.1 hypothetical protein NCCP1664_07570 [Zafaria cholistanensis]